MPLDLLRTRSLLGLSLCVVASAGAMRSARAETFHRLAVTATTGSEGALEFLQTTGTGSALQGEVNDQSVNTGIRLPFGVLGEYDPSTSSTFGIGVLGLSTSGYGVAAEAFGSNPAMLSESMGRGGALEAVIPGQATKNSNASAIYAFNYESGAAVQAIAADGNGLGATASGAGFSALHVSSQLNSPYAVFATNSSPVSDYGQGLHVESQSGTALVARSTSGNASYPVVALEAYKSGTDILDAFTMDSASSVDEPLRFTYPSANQSGLVGDPSGASDLQLQGDIYLAGDLYTRCSGGYTPSNCAGSIYGTARSNSGAAYRTYRPDQTEPTIERSGVARLVGGRAHVALESGFASTISAQRSYLVFTTAEGESKGLYVYDKTPSGFDVRENDDGQSSLTIDYRIVAYSRGPGAARSALRSAGTFVPRPSQRALAADAAADAFRSRMSAAVHPAAAMPILGRGR